MIPNYLKYIKVFYIVLCKIIKSMCNIYNVSIEDAKVYKNRVYKNTIHELNQKKIRQYSCV